MKKALSLILALAMIMALAVTGFAATGNGGVASDKDTLKTTGDTLTIAVPKGYVLQITGITTTSNEDINEIFIPKTTTNTSALASILQYANIFVPSDFTAAMTVTFNVGAFAASNFVVSYKLYAPTVEWTAEYDENQALVGYTPSIDPAYVGALNLAFAVPAPAPLASDKIMAAVAAAEKANSDVAIVYDYTVLTPVDFAYVMVRGMDLKICTGVTCITSTGNGSQGGFTYYFAYSKMTKKTIDGDIDLVISAGSDTWACKNPASTALDGLNANTKKAIINLTGDVVTPFFYLMPSNKVALPGPVDVTFEVDINWTRQYGHKNLNLYNPYVLTETKKGTFDGAEYVDIKESGVKLVKGGIVVSITKYDTFTVTLNSLNGELYFLTAKTIGDNAGASSATDSAKPANPNMGASDVVSVAAVFAVVSLAAAGAFAFRKVSK